MELKLGSKKRAQGSLEKRDNVEKDAYNLIEFFPT